MESLGNILNNSNLLKKSEKTATGPQLQPLSDREDAIRGLITRMYMSCRKDAPSPEILAYEVQIALEDLAEIPDVMLKDSFAEAVATSDGFLPGNGKILSVFRGKKGDQFEEAQRAIRMENNAKYLAAPNDDVPTEEQRAQIASEFAKLSELLRK